MSTPAASMAPESVDGGGIKRKREGDAPLAAAPVPKPAASANAATAQPVAKKAKTDQPGSGLAQAASASAAKRAETASAVNAAATKAFASSGSAPVKMEDDDDSSSSSDDSDDGKTLFSLVQSVAKKKPAAVAKKPSATKPAAAKKKKPVAKKKKPIKQVESSSDDDSSDSSDDSSDSSDSSDDSSDSSDSDDDRAKKRRSRKKRASGSRRSSKSSGAATLIDAAKFETYAKMEPLKATKGVNKWWTRIDEKTAGKSKKKWETLQHNGPVFAPPYEAHGVKMLYDGQEVDLTPAQEEVATLFAAMMDADIAKKPVFKKNFFRDWSKLLGKDHVVKEFDKCNFRPIQKHCLQLSEDKKLLRKDKEWKAKDKAEKAALMATYGTAIVNGYAEKVGNFRVEPPGLFRGRGEHPKTGTLKRRVYPEDVTLNVQPGTKIPPAPEGHQWKGVVHNPNVTWLAGWTDNVNNDNKYVWLSSGSQFKGESDLKKYTKAQKLKKYIGAIRKDYDKQMSHKSLLVRQRAVAMYLIDKLALRVGNEKDTSEVADTVGCCSLRVEHLTFPAEDTVQFDFLGKDSMQYLNTVKVPKPVWENLKSFCHSKSPNSEVFNLLSTSDLNEYLKTLMDDLTAKVFRTYNASITLQKELKESSDGMLIEIEDLATEKKRYYDAANRKVAVLCNHQRSVPKAFGAQMEKLVEKQKALKKKIRDTKKEMKGKKGTDRKKFKARVDRMEIQLLNHESKMANKEDNKSVALGTSKINYMDPRITIAWCKRKEVPIEKIFNKSLLDKFPWAMEVKMDWEF